MGLTVVLQHVACNAVDLHGQLPRGRDDKSPSAIPGLKFGAVEQLYAGYEEGQGFARSCRNQQSLSMQPIMRD